MDDWLRVSEKMVEVKRYLRIFKTHRFDPDRVFAIAHPSAARKILDLGAPARQFPSAWERSGAV